MEATATKRPWEMTRDEYGKAAAALLTPDGWPDYVARKAAGLNDNWDESITKAVARGEDVPQHIIDQLPPAVEAQEIRRLEAELGPNVTDRLHELAKAVTPVHEVMSRDGNSLVVRRRQLPGGGFHEHAKGDIVTVGGEPMVVTVAGKPYAGKTEDGVHGYYQKIKVREAKSAERATAERSVSAAAADQAAGWNNRSYPELKKKQMAEFAALARKALGGQS